MIYNILWLVTPIIFLDLMKYSVFRSILCIQTVLFILCSLFHSYIFHWKFSILHFSPLQDAPRDCETPCTVSAYKPGQGGCCLRCHYIHRGSFKTMTLPQLESQLKEHPALKEKCLGLLGRVHSDGLSLEPWAMGLSSI